MPDSINPEYYVTDADTRQKLTFINGESVTVGRYISPASMDVLDSFYDTES